MHSDPRKPLKVLIVDDNEDAADSLAAAVLEIVDYDTCVTYSGAQALECAGQYRPDVIILDINMPGLNGLQTARRLRMDSRMTSTVLVAHTAADQPLVRTIALQAGFQHFVGKGALASLTHILDILSKLDSIDGLPPSKSPTPMVS